MDTNNLIESSVNSVNNNNSAIGSNGESTNNSKSEKNGESVLNNNNYSVKKTLSANIRKQPQQQQHFNKIIYSSSSNMPKSNEPVKLVYPNAGNQSAVLNMNNRVTFTSQSMPNGTISLSPLTFTTSSQSNPSGQTIMHTTNTTGGVKVTALQGQQSQQNQQQQQQTLVIKNQVSMPTGISSNSPGIVTMTKTFNQVNIFFFCFPALFILGVIIEQLTRTIRFRLGKVGLILLSLLFVIE